MTRWNERMVLALVGMGSKELEGRLSDRPSGVGLLKLAADTGDGSFGEGILGGRGGESEGVGGVRDLD